MATQPVMTAGPVNTGRKVVTCAHCKLVQFIPQTNACRKCKRPLEIEIGEPLARVLAFPPVVKDEQTVQQALACGLQMLRRNKRLTQRQLAARIKCPRTYISKIENGKALPTITSCHKIAAGLRVSTSAFVGAIDIAEVLLAGDSFFKRFCTAYMSMDPAKRATCEYVFDQILAQQKTR